MSTIPQTRIIEYREEFKEIFRNINYEWIERDFEVTELDRRVFDNPIEEIIDKGGYIYLAEYKNEIVGSVALEKLNEGEYALTRMGVKIGFQGKGMGKALIDIAINKSKKLEGTSLVLYTNQVLVKALNLYFRNGFRVVTLDKVPYKRATIKMELKLSKS